MDAVEKCIIGQPFAALLMVAFINSPPAQAVLSESTTMVLILFGGVLWILGVVFVFERVDEPDVSAQHASEHH